MGADDLTVMAVDWSGRRDDAGGTWLARAEGGLLVDLRKVTRAGAVGEAIRRAASDPRLVVGLDFAFSFPAWVLELRGEPPDVWEVVRDEGEGWLASCPTPFFGRKGTTAPLVERFRRTELDLRARGLRPTSVFQVAGRGAVGTGSLRGMPHLLTLLEAGFTVWPFGGTPARWPLVLEVWPRLFTGPMVKTDLAARAELVHTLAPRLGAFPEVAVAVEDAFDAAVTALGMADRAAELLALGPVHDAVRAAEGEVWPNEVTTSQ